MVRGWIQHADDRHHGAHGGEASRSLDIDAHDFLDFSQNINPLGAPAGVLAAARRALSEDIGHYPDIRYQELREAMSTYLGVPTGSVLPTNGGAEALFLAARVAAVGRPGGKALIPEPTFSEYAAAARTAGLAPVRAVARRREDGFRLSRKVFEDLSDVAVIFLCNPNNPTGEALPREEVLEIARHAREAGTVLVLDEAFTDFAPEISAASEVGEYLIVARSFTKFFGIPGLRLGCLVTPDPEYAAAFQPSWSVNAVAAATGVAAVSDVEFIERALSEVAGLRESLRASLAALPGLDTFPGAANFLLVRGPEGIVERLARRGVLVRGCDLFMGLGPGYFRVAVRGPEENASLIEVLKEEL